MARANRHYLPGYVWHITHRCHKREFLLKFARDQRRWLQWLFEAKKRFGTSILKYTVTSNHVHLVIRDDKGEEVIPQTMQLVAGRAGQEYNQRKNRKGAFWEDRYHATAVDREYSCWERGLRKRNERKTWDKSDREGSDRSELESASIKNFMVYLRS